MRGKNGNYSERQIESAAPCCAICGSGAVLWDEVDEQESLMLGECLHCEYRWTRLASPPSTRTASETFGESGFAQPDVLVEAA